MKVAQIKKYGHADQIEILDVEIPNPTQDQVLVKVYASSINPFDIALREGLVAKTIPIQFPFNMGGDVAGVVKHVGKNVSGFSIGSKVYGSANALSGSTGAFAEFAAIPAGNIAKMPSNLDFHNAASMVLTGVSAVQALIEHIKLLPRQKILIHGGAGGIGTVAIQVAKSLHAYVTTTATADEIDYVKKLGADEVIDYIKENFQDRVSNYDAALDVVGGGVFESSFKVLKKGGILVSMVAKDTKNLAKTHHATAISQFTKINTQRLDALTDFIEHRNVKPHIDKIFTLDKIKDAFLEKEKGHVLGKIVISING